jgi:hypothetical protein
VRNDGVTRGMNRAARSEDEANSGRLWASWVWWASVTGMPAPTTDCSGRDASRQPAPQRDRKYGRGESGMAVSRLLLRDQAGDEAGYR